jgi:diguanylate cyclase (GGDEF)-like protein
METKQLGSARPSLDFPRLPEPRQHTPVSRPAAARPERDRVILLELGGTQPGAVFSIHAPGALIGRGSNADVTMSDASVSWEHARLTLDDDGACIEDLSSTNGTFVNNQRVEQRTRLVDGDYLRLGDGGTVLKFSMVDEFEERALRTLFELTLRDPLTRLYNRRYFDDRLRGEFAFAQRHGTVLGLLLVDIDHFKQVNDRCGHQVGDIVLKLVASSIQKMMRPEDVLARYGGEEFVVIVRATSLRNLEILGSRVCHRVEALSPDLPDRELTVTVSVGASCMGPDVACASAEALLGAADQALYQAKTTGRNRASTTRLSEQRHPR